MAFAWARRAATFASQPQLVQEKEHPWKWFDGNLRVTEPLKQH
jgi:hypothetical protein